MYQKAFGTVEPSGVTTSRFGLPCVKSSCHVFGYGLGLGYSARAGRMKPIATIKPTIIAVSSVRVMGVFYSGEGRCRHVRNASERSGKRRWGNELDCHRR